MFSEFWLDGCCAGSSEFLLPLDSTPAYLTHLPAAAAADADVAEPARPANTAVATTSARGSSTCSAFFIRLALSLRRVPPGLRGRAYAERSCSAPVGKGWCPRQGGAWNSSIVYPSGSRR